MSIDITPAGIAKALGKLADRQWQAIDEPEYNGWWVVAAPWENEHGGGMNTIDESGDGGFNEDTAKGIAFALTALPLIAARMEALEADAARAIADKEAAEKRVQELEARLVSRVFDIADSVMAALATDAQPKEGR